MLSVAKVRRGGEAYYLEATRGSSPDRPGLVEPDGTWWGGLAETLGLADRTVEGASLSRLLAGVDPATGVPLDPGHARVRIAAFDCTFAAPKSVSLLHALGPADAVAEVRASQERAAAGALGYLERHAARVRRSGAVLPAEGLIAASFLHRTSRADDPHLHTHLVVANLAPDLGGRWSAIDARPLYAHAAVAGALYRAQLRYEISGRLAVAWQTRAEGFADLIGIPAAALRGFSRRSAEITAELARTGWTGSHSARVAADRTRPDKVPGKDYPALVAAWRERAFTYGVSESAVRRFGGGATRTADRHVVRGPELTERVADSAEALGRSFDRRELIRATCARLVGGAPVGWIEAAVDAHLGSGELVRCGQRALQLHAPGGGRIPAGLVETRFATKEIAALTECLRIAMESATLLDTAVRDGGWRNPGNPRVPGVFTTSRDADPILAYAALREVAVAAHDDGLRVVGLAPSRRLAAHLEAATGIRFATFEHREVVGGDSLVVVADPGRCPVRAVTSLVEQARAGGRTVVLFRGEGRPARLPNRHERGFAVDAVEQPGLGVGLTRHNVAGVEVVLASDLVAALGGIRLLGEELRVKGRQSLAVAVEPRGLAATGVEVVRPHEALRRCRTEDLHLIVFGGARVLGPGITRVPNGGRSHVVVVPVELVTGQERSFARELAEPAGLRRERGRSPDGRHAGDRWRVKATETERRNRARGLEPVHGRDEPAWSRGARIFEPSRQREPSLSR